MTTKELWSFRDQAVARVDLKGFELQALDGSLGTVAQAIEGSDGGYLIIDPGVAMPLGRQVFVPVGLIEKVDVDNKRVSVRAECEQIRSAPVYEPTQAPKLPEPGFIPSRPSLRTRLEHWISGHQH